MTLNQILLVLRARWLAALITFSLIVGTVVGVSLLLPKRYSSTATVLIDIKNTDPITGQNPGGMVQMSFIVTQVDIIKSGRVARRVIESSGLADNAALRSQWAEETEGRGEFGGWLAELLRRNLEVRPTRDSGALDITYVSQDPRFSATMANAFAQAYIDVNLDLRTEPARQFSTFFDERAKAAREALETAQSKLSTYQRERGLLATDERFDVETARLQELSTQALMLQALAVEASSRSSQTQSNSDRMAEVVNNGLVSSLKGDLSRQQARLEEISARLGEANPAVIELRANIAELQRRIAQETTRVAGSVGVNNNVAQTRLIQVQASLAEQRMRVLKLKQQRDEAAVLERDLEGARANYKQVSERQSQVGIESLARNSNVSLLERASEPLSHSSPRILLNTIVSVVLGLILALTVALLREWRDRRLRSAADVVEELDIPLLGVLPRATAKALARENGARQLLQHQLARA